MSTSLTDLASSRYVSENGGQALHVHNNSSRLRRYPPVRKHIKRVMNNLINISQVTKDSILDTCTFRIYDQDLRLE